MEIIVIKTANNFCLMDSLRIGFSDKSVYSVNISHIFSQAIAMDSKKITQMDLC
jgi:hypothetical protein